MNEKSNSVELFTSEDSSIKILTMCHLSWWSFTVISVLPWCKCDLHVVECTLLLTCDLQDLTAIGITQPVIRKRLTAEISRLRISDGIPNYVPVTSSLCTCWWFSAAWHLYDQW